MASSSTAGNNQTELENAFDHSEPYPERRQNRNCLMVIIKLLQEWVQSIRNDSERICPVPFITGASASGVSCQTLPSSHTAGPFDNLNSSASAFVASSSETKQTPYDVFINHCGVGQDVEYTLANRIYDSLNSTGLRVFLDKPELELGDYFPKAIEEAIKSSSIHIAIFCEHYAQSPRCLAELVCMLQNPSKFIPIFYDVDPSDLRWAIEEKGIYKGAFSDYVEKKRYPSELQRWKEALHKASFVAGNIIEKVNPGDEQRAVQHVVKLVFKEFNKPPLVVAKHPVGLDEAVKHFDEMIALESSGSTKIVGIWGMAGSGKTTLAKEIFNKRWSAMDRSSFLFDIREASTKGRLVDKQNKLLKDLDIKNVSTFDQVEEGSYILYRHLRSVSNSMLIILDDVDDTEQLDALLPGGRESLGHGSLIVVTSRELNVLKAWGTSLIYQMRLLNDTHAKQLFCWHAFLQPSPPLGFENLVEKFSNACHHLPLSLVVVGSDLCGRRSKDYWRSLLQKFSRILPSDISARLKVSYDALYDEEKEMFLDTACFFIGEKINLAIKVWDGLGWRGLYSWEKLCNKCLVEVSKDGLIRMHDHLRDLGREIANGRSPYRLWSPHQVIQIHRQQDAIRVRGMANAVGDNCYQREGKIIIKTSKGERILEPCSLGLKIFFGNGEFLNPELSRELIWLKWTNFEHKNLPSGLALIKLRILELFDFQSLEDLWEWGADAPLLETLQTLRIYNCPKLKRLTNLARLRNLKEFDSQMCPKLEKIEGLENIQSLQRLRICDSPKLNELPSLVKLTSIEDFDFGMWFKDD